MVTEHRHALPKGYKIDDYRIESVLGSGGFGITYCARDLETDRRIAIKEYLPAGVASRDRDDASVHPLSEADREEFEYGLNRFRDEAKTLVNFEHPNIVTAHRFFSANGTAYLVMQLIEGKTLQGILAADKTLTEHEIDEILSPLLDGMEAVHKAGFLHRDIKPGNIVIRLDGAPILIDFGAARPAVSEKTRTTIVSAGYAPIEQYESHGNQGAWTDIYAMGAVLYRCVTGTKPPMATDRVRGDTLQPAAELAKGAGYGKQLLAAIDRALAVDETARPQSVATWRAMFLASDAIPHVREEIEASSDDERAWLEARTKRSAEAYDDYLMAHGEKGAHRDEALSAIREAADRGDSGAMSVLGSLYEDGLHLGQDADEAVRWYRKAAELGNVGAMRALGWKYLAEKYYEEGVRWLRRAADGGDVDTMFTLGTFHHQGYAAHQNYRKAMRWYRKAVDKGHVLALYGIGELYKDGLGVARDYGEAMRLYREAADKGAADAMRTIGELHEDGLGVARDYGEAMRRYREAADQHDAKAMANIGWLYEEGRGVDRDKLIAKRWFSRAGERYEEEQQRRRDALHPPRRRWFRGLLPGILEDFLHKDVLRKDVVPFLVTGVIYLLAMIVLWIAVHRLAGDFIGARITVWNYGVRLGSPEHQALIKTYNFQAFTFGMSAVIASIVAYLLFGFTSSGGRAAALLPFVLLFNGAILYLFAVAKLEPAHLDALFHLLF